MKYKVKCGTKDCYEEIELNVKDIETLDNIQKCKEGKSNYFCPKCTWKMITRGEF